MSQTINLTELNDLLHAGDILINCTSEAVAVAVPSLNATAGDDIRVLSGPAYPVRCHAESAVAALRQTDFDRCVFLCESAENNVLVDAVAAAGMAHTVYVIQAACEADAFMDEEDSEAVAERLRQLGYI